MVAGPSTVESETMEHNTTTPDVDTASEDYARRFRGPIGEYLLRVQGDGVARLVRWPDPTRPLRVLEVGGGHGQLTPLFLERGCEVWVQGSDASCEARIKPLFAHYPDRLHFVVSNLWNLPFEDNWFDLVVAIRLLSHVEDWRPLLREMTRVCKNQLLIDYAPVMSANLLEPVLFHVKRRIEKNTRPYFCYTKKELESCLKNLDFNNFCDEKQFFAPMVVHRALGRPALSSKMENCFSALGLTALFGGPVLLLAERNANGEQFWPETPTECGIR